MNCACGSNQTYEKCCQPFISGKALPETAEALMRSRYSAFALCEMEYLKNTLAPESRSDFDMTAAKKWAKESKWMGLQIVSTDKGLASDTKGTVEFIATYEPKGQPAIDHHEVAQFRKTEQGQWLFVDGDSHTHKAGEGHHHHTKPVTVVRESEKIGRNDPCSCGSGKKYKKCCGA